MKRPDYESFTDVVRQHEAADEIREAWHIGVYVYPRHSRSRIDFRLFDVSVIGVGELKCRGVAHDAYPDLLLSRDKWTNLWAAEQKWAAPAYLFVRYADGLYWARAIDDNVTRRAIAGRYDRADPWDLEPCVFIKGDAFRKVAHTWDG